MKKVILIVAALFLIILLLPGCSGAKVSELEAKISTLESNLANKTNEAADLQSQLNDKDPQINDLNDKLTTKDGQISDLSSQADGKDVEIGELNDKLKTQDSQITDLNSQLETLEGQVAELEAQIPQLSDPTYQEALAFIYADKTDEEVPSDYALAAMLVAENAAEQGIKAYWVVARLAGGGYNFIGFHTTDKGWIYFAANADFEVKLVEGEKYSVINNMSTSTIAPSSPTIAPLVTLASISAYCSLKCGGDAKHTLSV